MEEEFYKKFIKEQPEEVIIAKLIQNDERAKEIQELEKQNEVLQGFVSSIFNNSFEKDYIPKLKIKEKIKELDKLIKEAQIELGSASKEFTIYVYQKDILQELLD